MTYLLKAFIVALTGATALTAQISTAHAMGSDRSPNTTNMIIRSSTQEYVAAQKNTVFIHPNAVTHASPIGNKYFLEQR